MRQRSSKIYSTEFNPNSYVSCLTNMILMNLSISPSALNLTEHMSFTQLNLSKYQNRQRMLSLIEDYLCLLNQYQGL